MFFFSFGGWRRGSRTPAVVVGPRNEATAIRTTCYGSGYRSPSYILSVCVLRGLQSAHPPPRWYCYGAGLAFLEGELCPVLCRVCHVFLPLVSLFGLFPVLVKFVYQLIMSQLCFLIIVCIYSPVCSVWFCLFYSLLPGVPVCVYLALSSPALFGVIKDCLFQSHPHLRVPRSSLMCASWHLYFTILFYFYPKI